MATIVVDNESETAFRRPPPPGFVPPAICELLSEPVSNEAAFYLIDGRPYILYKDWDYAEDWSLYPVREVHPYFVLIEGKEVDEAEFRSVVRKMHEIV